MCLELSAPPGGSIFEYTGLHLLGGRGHRGIGSVRSSDLSSRDTNPALHPRLLAVPNPPQVPGPDWAQSGSALSCASLGASVAHRLDLRWGAHRGTFRGPETRPLGDQSQTWVLSQAQKFQGATLAAPGNQAQRPPTPTPGRDLRLGAGKRRSGQHRVMAQEEGAISLHLPLDLCSVPLFLESG